MARDSHPTETETTDRLRHALDSGRTGDTGTAPDPAAAPPGPDDEAAGAPATPEQARMAAREELTRGWRARAAAPRNGGSPPPPPVSPVTLGLVVLVLLVAAILIGFALTG